MRTYFLLASVLIVVPLHFSCKKDCTNTKIGVWIEGFDSTEYSVVVITKYPAGSNFKGPLDEHVYVLDSSIYKIAGDTIYHAKNNNDWPNLVDNIDIGYDWTVELPIAGKRYELSHIFFDDLKKNVGGRGDDPEYCSNDLFYDSAGVPKKISGETIFGSNSGYPSDYATYIHLDK